MPRLPPPSIPVRTERGRALDLPRSPLLVGIRHTSYRPVRLRTLRPVASSAAAAVPAGYVDVAAAAAALDRPEELLVFRALHHPELLPPHVMHAGRPIFRTTDLPGVPS